MGRIKTGFQLLGQSWSVIKRDPELIAVIAVGFIAQLTIFLVLFFLAFSRAPQIADFRFPRFLWLYPIMFASGLVGSLAGATVIAAADRFSPLPFIDSLPTVSWWLPLVASSWRVSTRAGPSARRRPRRSKASGSRGASS